VTVALSIGKFGIRHTSSLKKLPAYDNVIQSVTGFQAMTGFAGTSGVRCGSAVGDSFTGMNCALAILMAYRKKLKTGKGSRIDLSMFDCIFGILEPHILANTVNGENHQRVGNSDKYLFAPCDVYECKDGWFSIGITSNAEFRRFCESIGNEKLCEDERFITNEDRCLNNDALTDEISGFFKDKTKAELEELLRKKQVKNAPLLSIPEIIEHPQTKARNLIVEINDPGIGNYTVTGNPMFMTETPATYDKGAPLLGEDTKRILEELGYSSTEIKEII
jgi:CoA:oxalate CoA-transferase